MENLLQHWHLRLGIFEDASMKALNSLNQRVFITWNATGPGALVTGSLAGFALFPI
jgi:hypothetical protein